MSRYGMRRSAGSRRYSLGMMLTGWAAVGLAVILVGATLYGYVKYRDVLDGINHETISVGNEPPKLGTALNVLVIGSDSRSGRNGKIGGPAVGQRSDTVMIAHISPGSGHITVLSFPRDSVVPIYSCPSEPDGFAGQTAAPGSVEQLNGSFAAGGANCLWKTIEHTTGIHLDNFIQLNFTGFISVINAINGVPVCLPTAIHKTSYDRLKLSAGRHVLKGYKALEFWRLREGFGLGSDLQRIQRDQLLMVGLVQKILKTGVLHSLSKTWGIIDAISKAHALTTDAGLTTEPDRHDRAERQRHLEEEHPVHRGSDGHLPRQRELGRVRYVQDAQALQRHPARPDPAQDRQGQEEQEAREVEDPAAQAAQRVQCQRDRAERIRCPVHRRHDGGRARHPRFPYPRHGQPRRPPPARPITATQKSVVEYSAPADLAAAQTVAAQLPDVTVKQVAAVTAGTVTLIIGSDFTKLGPPPSQPVGNLTGQFGGYKGSTNACKGYGTAFLSSSG